MTAIYLMLALAFLLPVGWFGVIIRREELGLCQWRADRIAAEIERLTVPLPPKRDDLGPLPPVHQPPRVRPAWDTPTGQFWVIVDHAWDLTKPCSHCATPEELERPHAACSGCSCPCRSPELVAA